ncbi:MAG: hypothetical protein M1825_005678 [Sarcosagium campestre]|nr:MAG: hypothetical protein M1825_005678 [Sarcosagium campestre]
MALVTARRGSDISELYLYLINRPEYSSSVDRKRLSRRLREVLMKGWTIVGIPLVLEGLTALSKVERLEDSDAENLRKGLQLDAAVEQRGSAHLESIYKHNLQPIFNTWGSHAAEFEWLETNIIYGLFLSEFAVLDAVETSLVTVPAMLCQGVKAPTIWHLRGLRRLGVSQDDVQRVIDVVKLIAKDSSQDVTDWPRASDVGEDV